MDIVGIYKITNLINGHCYVGQSRHIHKRWQDHKITSHNKNDKGYNYPLYKAFRKYGLVNFSFEIIEECTVEELNEKEHYWIKKLSPEYNQTEGGDYQVHGSKLTYAEVQEIRKILMDKTKKDISYPQIAKMFGVHEDTIRDINTGRTWKESKLSYPLRISQFDCTRTEKKIWYCKKCHKEISKGAEYCMDCRHQLQRQQGLVNIPITRNELKKLIRTTSFLQIGKMFNVSDNAIRKWCIKYNLPSKKKDIKLYSDEEWSKI